MRISLFDDSHAEDCTLMAKLRALALSALGFAAICLVTLFLWLISPHPTDTDRSCLARVEKRFGSDYIFSFQADMYVSVKRKQGTVVDLEEAKRIVREFWEPGGAEFGFIFFNFYSSDGVFQFRLQYRGPNEDMYRYDTPST